MLLLSLDMPESLGARLRRRREEQGIDLIAIAAQTKIKLSLLEALERDDVSHWPSGIFRRAYIRTYAHAIGLNPDDVVRDFLEAHPEPAEVVTTEAIASALDGGRKNGGPPTRLRYIVGSAIDSLTRLRRSPPVENLVVADGGWIHVPAPAEPEPASARTTPPEPLEPDVTAAPDTGRPVEATSAVPHIEPVDPGPRIPAVDARRPAVAAHHPVVAAPVEPSRQPPAAADPEPARPDPDFLAVARLCTEFSRVQTSDDLQMLLQDAAAILEASGLIIWAWDEQEDGLRPVMVHGYSEKLLAQLPTVRRDDDNATATAFRSGQTCAIKGRAHTSGALAAPLITPDGCVGVLAIELPPGREQEPFVRATATIFATMLAQLVGRAEASDGQEADASDGQEADAGTLPLETDELLHENARR